MFTRASMRLATVGGRLKQDDYLACISTALGIVQSVTAIYQGAQGLGKHGNVLPADQLSALLKSQYAGNVLFIATLLVAKLSATATVNGIATPEYGPAIVAVDALIVLWACTSVFTLLFQCQLPEPWSYIDGQCLDRRALWIYINAVNMTTELLITAIPIYMFRRLQVPSSKKSLVIGLFGCRNMVSPKSEDSEHCSPSQPILEGC